MQYRVKQVGKLNTISKTLNKVFVQHFDVFKKFLTTSENFQSAYFAITTT